MRLERTTANAWGDRLGVVAVRARSRSVMILDRGMASFSLGKVKKNKNKGTAMLTVVVPGPGGLDLIGTGKMKGTEKRAVHPHRRHP